MSAALVAWRYFNPLPAAATQILAGAPASQGANSTDLSDIKRDVLHLLDFAVAQTTVSFLNELYESAPPSGDPLKIEEGFRVKDEEARTYLRRASADLGDTLRGLEFRELMQRSAVDAEIMVKGTPAEQRPEGVDPLDLREHAIAALQCGRAHVFFWQQKCKVEAQIRNQRSNLIERLRLQNPSR